MKAGAALEVGCIEAIYRYPVKSMRGERLEAAAMGWHGLEGDRRLALRRIEERGGFPWLQASKLHELVLFTPVTRGDGNGLPTHVRTPEGAELPVFGEELAAEIGRRHRAPVQMMHLDRGIFDETPISVITSTTIAEVCRLAERPADVRRFRPNILVRSTRAAPFEENDWVGGVLTFGDGNDAPAVTVTMRDVRCVMVNLDPDDASHDAGVMKTVVRENQNCAGIYATVTRTGRVAVGQTILLHR
jgi:hypothetical protein